MTGAKGFETGVTATVTPVLSARYGFAEQKPMSVMNADSRRPVRQNGILAVQPFF